MKLLKHLITSLIITATVNASVVLEKGQVAPYSGLLFTQEEAQKLKNELQELSLTKELNVSLNNSLELYKKSQIVYEDSILVLQNRNDILVQTIKDLEPRSDLEKIGLFALGVLTTTVITYAAAQALK
jgi:hypothetical protein